MNIYQIKSTVLEVTPDNHFFDKDALALFHQTMKDFKVTKRSDGAYAVVAPIRNNDGVTCGHTRRIYSPKSGELFTALAWEREVKA